MIDVRGLRETIREIKSRGESMRDIRDLQTLYSVLEYMEGEKKESAERDGQGLTRQKAEKWVASMANEDPARPEGGKWTLEQVKPYAQKHGIPTEGEKLFGFFAVMNAMYSDYSEVAKKYNAATPDFFAEMAKAFIQDKDAVPDKVGKYYETIVKH